MSIQSGYPPGGCAVLGALKRADIHLKAAESYGRLRKQMPLRGDRQRVATLLGQQCAVLRVLGAVSCAVGVDWAEAQFAELPRNVADRLSGVTRGHRAVICTVDPQRLAVLLIARQVDGICGRLQFGLGPSIEVVDIGRDRDRRSRDGDRCCQRQPEGSPKSHMSCIGIEGSHLERIGASTGPSTGMMKP